MTSSPSPSTLLWAAFVAVVAADAILPGPSYSVFCLPIFFAFLAIVRPRFPWPLAVAAVCILVGAWLLEQGLRSGLPTGATVAGYRLVDRLILSIGILLETAVQAKLQLIYDDVVSLRQIQVTGRIDAAGEASLASLKRTVLAASTLTLAAVFVIDVATPRDVNLGSLYLLPVLWVSALQRPSILLAFLPASIACSLAGYYVGPVGVIPEPRDVLLDRLLSIGAVLSTDLFLVGWAYWRSRQDLAGREGP